MVVNSYFYNYNKFMNNPKQEKTVFIIKPDGVKKEAWWGRYCLALKKED